MRSYSNLFPPKPVDLKTRLESALSYVQRTCVFGSTNKIENIEKTNNWVHFINVRYGQPGKYIKNTKGKLSQGDRTVNAMYNPNTKKLDCNKSAKWIYHTDYLREMHKGNFSQYLFPVSSVINPVEDPIFQLSESHCDLLVIGMLVQQKRQGNCKELSCLLAKYLWENNAGIQRIEVVKATTFDHAFVIVNRVGNINKPETWGSAWIIDPWHKSGVIYSASEFKIKIQEIRKAALVQASRLKLLNIVTLPAQDQTAEEKLITDYDIKPQKDRYPTYSLSPFHPIESYYNLACNYALDGKNLAELTVGMEGVAADLKLQKLRFASTLSLICSKPKSKIDNHSKNRCTLL